MARQREPCALSRQKACERQARNAREQRQRRNARDLRSLAHHAVQHNARDHVPRGGQGSGKIGRHRLDEPWQHEEPQSRKRQCHTVACFQLERLVEHEGRNRHHHEHHAGYALREELESHRIGTGRALAGDGGHESAHEREHAHSQHATPQKRRDVARLLAHRVLKPLCARQPREARVGRCERRRGERQQPRRGQQERDGHEGGGGDMGGYQVKIAAAIREQGEPRGPCEAHDALRRSEQRRSQRERRPQPHACGARAVCGPCVCQLRVDLQDRSCHERDAQQRRHGGRCGGRDGRQPVFVRVPARKQRDGVCGDARGGERDEIDVLQLGAHAAEACERRGGVEAQDVGEPIERESRHGDRQSLSHVIALRAAQAASPPPPFRTCP